MTSKTRSARRQIASQFYAIVDSNIYPVGQIAPGDDQLDRWLVVTQSGCSVVLRADSVVTVIGSQMRGDVCWSESDPIRLIARCRLVEQVTPDALKPGDMIFYPRRNSALKHWEYSRTAMDYAEFVSGMATLSVKLEDDATFFRVVR